MLPKEFFVFSYSLGKAYYLKKVADNYYNLMTTLDGASSVTTGCGLEFTPTDMAQSDILYIVGQKGGNIYLSYNCTNTTLIGFGSSAKITMDFDRKNIVVVITDGMCQSGVFSNNNEMNKCTFYK